MMSIGPEAVDLSQQAKFKAATGHLSASNIDYSKSAAWRLEAVVPQVCIGGDVWPE